ncbi:hypothetical protein ACF1G0_09945 [Streptomyces sp. NPDC013953]|uniref:hypothetical protein n=1 Tax=Streptomyces sp. NPDC013953 TaxID=3364868 RepID=UPI0036FFFCFB
MHTTTTPAPAAGRAAEPSALDTGLVWATALALALVPVAFLYGAMAGMAADVHPRTVAVVTVCWWASWTATPPLVLAFRLGLGRPRLATAGRWAGCAACVPPVATIVLALGL